MSFLYPRTVAVRRPTPSSGAGGLGYSGETAANETLILSGAAASIQHRAGKGRPPGDLPADASNRADWYIFIRSPNLGQIAERDVVVDDLGKRYQVSAAYWNSLGYRIAAQLLEI